MHGRIRLDNTRSVQGGMFTMGEDTITTLTFGDGDSTVVVYLTPELRARVHNLTGE